MHRPPSRSRPPLSFRGLIAVLSAVLVAVVVWRLDVIRVPRPEGSVDRASPVGDEDAAPEPGGGAEDPPGQPPPPEPDPGPAPINRAFEGLTTFRGNATRTYYGEGPVPRDPVVVWRYPASGGLCRLSSAGGESKRWCGTGWTGQPNAVVGRNGRVQVRFGAYDGAVHVVDGSTGRPLKEPFTTGDLIKGTVTTDPDGFPLLYVGSRDNSFRVLALDRGRRMVELWRLGADTAPRPLWNDDWDSSALVIRDHLLVGGENSWFYVVRLNRRYDGDGKVAVRPQIRAMFPGFDDELLEALGDRNVSIESSPAFRDGVVYFANSGGLVQGWDVSAVLRGGTEARRVFRFWTGDDTDASVVIDEEGYLYVASELERFNARAGEVGQLMKLDPRRRRDPVVWSLPVPGAGGAGGIWATPALHGPALYVPTNTGRLLGVNRMTGKVRWEIRLPGPTWSSPAVVDDTLVVGDCEGVLHAYDVSRPLRRPRERWTVRLEGCIESTPAVWRGMVYVGARGGAVYGIGDRV